ncbi:MAG: hypothetical protein KA064_01625 [Firmicutes bacterium]|nr:hypothetical protein [Bacillota bacterium]
MSHIGSINVGQGAGGVQPGARDRLVLPDVARVGRRLGGGRNPERIPFPSCLAACLRYIGDYYPWIPVREHSMDCRLDHSYIQTMGVTGMAFGLVWGPGWSPGNAGLMSIADPDEIIDRAFRAAGRSYEAVWTSGKPADSDVLRRTLLESLESGRPVLAFGVIGPPECCVITGYDCKQDAVIGWSFYQDDSGFEQDVEYEPNGYFKLHSWAQNTAGLIVVGDRTDRGAQPFDSAQSALAILNWALHVIHTPDAHGRKSGLAAYAAWTEQLMHDPDFVSSDEQQLRQRYAVHDSAVDIVAECRWTASHFLTLTADAVPELSAPLLVAAEYYRQEYSLMLRIWSLVGGRANSEAHIRFANPAVRRRIAGIISSARDADARAAGMINQAVTAQITQREHPGDTPEAGSRWAPPSRG